MRRFLFIPLILAVTLTACTPQAEPLPTVPAIAPTPSPLPATPTQKPAPISTDDEFGSQPIAQPYAPQPGDEKLQRDTFFVDHASIVMAESFPPQFFVQVSGSAPTPCHQLRVTVTPPNGSHRIVVNLFTVVNPQTMCTQNLKHIDLNIPLGKFPAGKYEVWLNNQPVGQIQAP